MSTEKHEGRARTRERARNRAREGRTRARRRDLRRKIVVRSSILVGLIGLVSVVAVILVTSIRPAGPGPRNMADDGIAIGRNYEAVAASSSPAPTPGEAGSPARVRVYSDFHCPSCKHFEQENGEYLGNLVASGKVIVEYHPIAIVDRLSAGSKYSTRSAAAAACIADISPSSYFEANLKLMANQPAPNAKGPDNALLAQRLDGIEGLKNRAEVKKCVESQRFAGWVTDATKKVTQGDMPGTDAKTFKGTPTVFVNGREFDSTTSSFKEYLDSVIAKK